MDDIRTLKTLKSWTAGWDALRRPLWLWDPVSLRGIYANRAALALWDAKSLADLLARDFSNLSPAVVARTKRLAEATADGSEVGERWTFYPKGQPVTVKAVISTFVMPDGSAVLMFEAARTEIEAAERRSVEALRHSSTVITLFDEAGAPIFANPAAFATYGVVEHPFLARFADPDQGTSMLARALAGETMALVCQAETAAGSRWHHMDARPVLDPVTGAPGVILNERDVTSRVEAEQARTAAEQRAAMAQARQHFLSEMSHELRTPLNAVIGFSELLAGAALGDEQRDQARRIFQAGQQLNAVVSEMIAFSESGQGKPLALALSAPAEPEMQPAQAGSSHNLVGERNLSVLYVDDNANNRMLVATVLAAHGIDCRTANDGREGVEAAGSGAFDLILMDIQMPVMDGVEASRAIRRFPTPADGLPIIAVTANTLDEQLENYARAGMDDCISKPVDLAELIEKVFYWGEAARTGRSAAEAAASAGRRA